MKERIPMKSMAFVAVLIFLMVAATVVGAGTWRVNPDGTGDVPTIEAAVNASAPGDTILLGEGTFTGAGNRGVIVEKSLVIRSVSGPELTIIDCEYAAPSFIIWPEPGDYTISLEGVSIRKAGCIDGCHWLSCCAGVTCNANYGTNLTIENCVISGSRGAGVYVVGDDLWVRNSIIEDNESCGLDLGGVPAQIIDCVIRRNGIGIRSTYYTDLWVKNSTIEDNGLGIECRESFDEITDCVIRRNRVGLSRGEGNISVERCLITMNYEWAVEGDYNSSLDLTDSDIIGNGAANSPDDGSVISLLHGRIEIVGNRFYDNTGRLVYSGSARVNLERNIIARNHGPIFVAANQWSSDWFDAHIVGNTIVDCVAGGGAFFQLDLAQANAEGNILAFNTSQGLVSFGKEAAMTFANNNLFANVGFDAPAGDGNFSADPWFCNRGDDVYTLQDASPCLPGGNNPSGELIGALGQGCTALVPELVIAPPVLSGQLHGTLKVTLARGDGVDVDDIDPTTIRLAGVLKPVADTDGDPDAGSKHKLKLHFEKADVVDILMPLTSGDTRRVWLTAETRDGHPVRASADIKIGHIDGAANAGPNGVPAPPPAPAPPITPGIASVTPNPFNPVTSIRFGVVREGVVDLTVYDVAGRLVARLAHETMPAGEHEVTWEAGSVASGVYFARLITPEGKYTRKLVVTK